MKPLIIGTGLFCLDVVYAPGDSVPSLFAGGSSLNVASILTEYGWDAKLIGRIGDDQAAQYLLNDLAAFDVDATGIVKDGTIDTPLYSETFDDDGHCFQRQCLQCGAPSPEVKALDEVTMQTMIQHLPDSIEAAIIERDFPSALQLAKACKQRGALVYVELNRMSDEERCLKLISLAHIYKYARDRCGLLPAQEETPIVPLEIETMGRDGLRYRCNGTEWHRVPAHEVVQFIDAAGSGDWVSATILNHFARKGVSGFDLKASFKAIMVQAQAEAAENGKYIGARGRLYFERTIQKGLDYCPKCGKG